MSPGWRRKGAEVWPGVSPGWREKGVESGLAEEGADFHKDSNFEFHYNSASMLMQIECAADRDEVMCTMFGPPASRGATPVVLHNYTLGNGVFI